VTLLVLLYVWAPAWAKASAEALDRDALGLRASGRAAELPARYRRAVGLRLFGAPAAIEERLGAALLAAGDSRGAAAAYRDAIALAGEPVPLALLVGLAHSALEAGADDEAIGALRAVVAIDAGMPRIRPSLARALLRRGREADLPEAAELAASLPASDEGERQLLQAYVLARRGQTAAARQALAEIEGGPAPLRAEVETAAGGGAADEKRKKKKR